jgi:hypothetical protein
MPEKPDVLGNELYLWGAAQLLQVNLQEVKRLMHAGLLVGFRDRRHRWRILRKDLDAYLLRKATA